MSGGHAGAMTIIASAPVRGRIHLADSVARLMATETFIPGRLWPNTQET